MIVCYIVLLCLYLYYVRQMEGVMAGVKKDEENIVRLNEKGPVKKQVLSTEVKENE